MASSVARERRYIGDIAATHNLRHGGGGLLKVFLFALEDTPRHLLAAVRRDDVTESKLRHGIAAEGGSGPKTDRYT